MVSRRAHTEQCYFHTFQEGPDFGQEIAKHSRDFFLNKVPLELELRAHLPDDLGIPIHMATLRGRVVAVVDAPRVVLTCRGSRQSEARKIITTCEGLTPVPLLPVRMR